MENLLSSLFVSPGWQVTGPLSEQSGIITIVAGAGVGLTAQQQILALTVPPAARAYVTSLSFRVVDMAGFDQVFFSLKRNGAKIAPWEKISGEQIVDEHIVPVDQEFGPGLLEIGGVNISGTTESGAAAAAGGIRVIARVKGYLLR